MSSKRRSIVVRFILAVLGLIAVGWFCVPFITVEVWVGGFDLNVHLVNNTDLAVKSIEGSVVDSRAAADFAVECPGRPNEYLFKPLDLDPNNCVPMWVRCTGRVYLGRERNYQHYRGLVFRVEFEDGSQSVFAADIPPERGVRQLDVNIPPPF